MSSTATNGATLERPGSSLPDDGHYTRNLIGGRWQFPGAPYEFEIRNPSDSTITAVVPLSSRFDVDRAFAAAASALTGPWAEPAERIRILQAVIDRIDANRTDLGRLQVTETGLSMPDSLAALDATVAVARAVLSRSARAMRTGEAGVSGHILSWGLPFTEIVTSVLPGLVRGDTVIVKPSLRGPLSPVAFAYLAGQAGLPPGVVNIVQGTGVDVGAELISRRDLSALHVRAAPRTIAQAQRAHDRSGISLHTLHAGGNAMIVGPEGDVDLAALTQTIVTAVRMNSNGGPFGLPVLAVHRDRAAPVLAAVLEQLSRTTAAPLPTDPLRQRALGRIGSLVAAGAAVLAGGGKLPDDVAHRMGWRMPPTVLALGSPDSPAVAADQASVPLGPVLGVIIWQDLAQLGSALTSPRHRHGIASVWGIGEQAAALLDFGLVTAGSSASSRLGASLAPAWTGDAQ
jgi:acyl-CoA reductase-like NAD-dependent aldehyde dehydrogenase